MRPTFRIQARPETVWDPLTNVQAYTDWNPTVVNVEGEVALGERIKFFAKINPKRAFPVKVTRLERPRAMTWQGGMPLGLFKGVRTFTLTSRDDGATEFDMHEVFSGLMSGLIGRSIPDLQPSFDEFAAALKQRAETLDAT